MQSLVVEKNFFLYIAIFFFDFENIGGPTGGRMGRASSTMVCTRHQSRVYICECVVLGGMIVELLEKARHSKYKSRNLAVRRWSRLGLARGLLAGGGQGSGRLVAGGGQGSGRLVAGCGRVVGHRFGKIDRG
jgi:hypothetical protein